MNRIKSLFSFAALCLASATPLMLSSCGDDVEDGAYYTFTGQTVASYARDTEGHSIFAALLKDTGNDALLSSYGHYTVFMPTDNALEKYLNDNGKTYDSLTQEEKSEIVYNHVIKSGGNDYKSETFEEGSLPETTMSDNYITISFHTDDLGSGLVIYINKTTPIIEKDIEVHNGVIHVVGGVIEPSKNFLLDAIKENGEFDIFAQALETTELNKKLELIYDESYVAPYPDGELVRGESKFFVPTVKRYGFTLFAESDKVMNANGITSLEDLTAYAESFYGTSAQGEYTNPENALNKFVAYHLLNRQMNTNEFLYNGPCTMTSFMDKRTEYYETMYTYRLMEIKAGNKINQLANGNYVGIDESNCGISAVNGFAHGITDMLVYDEDIMINDVLNKRIRFDFYNVPPELTNNNIRWQLTSLPQGYSGYVIPNDFCSDYLSFSDETEITMWASDGWTNFEADELKLNGWYDFTLRMLPIPPGSYEIRIGYRQESWRGIAQLFVDGEIQGIPRDLRIAGTDPMVGWEADDQLSPAARAENDKAMRNRGYMKAPASIYTPQNGGTSLRNIAAALRIIVGQFNFQEYGAHYLRGKNVYAPDQEFHGDYIEIIPTSLIDREDIY
ncbi:MAG: fasciclin domain-containing protein [Bacteroides sp.]|nr:fasciclin domain-containing protein [Bacteroides sp.]